MSPRGLKRPSASMVVAIVALLVALSGTAVAASFVITSTDQIAPKVLKKLKGNRGKQGKQGRRGKQGIQGKQGVQGVQGVEGVQGVAGPTAGGFASTQTNATLSTTAKNVITLSGGTGAITAPAGGRLIVNASALFQKTNSAGLADADCTLVMSTNSGGFTAIGQTMNRDYQNAFENESLSATAGAAVAAGSTYNVALSCVSFNGTVVFIRGDMTAVFVG